MTRRRPSGIERKVEVRDLYEDMGREVIAGNGGAGPGSELGSSEGRSKSDRSKDESCEQVESSAAYWRERYEDMCVRYERLGVQFDAYVAEQEAVRLAARKRGLGDILDEVGRHVTAIPTQYEDDDVAQYRRLHVGTDGADDA